MIAVSFGMGVGELLVVLVVLLLVFGPGRLPEMMGSLGKAMREFKKGLHEPPEIENPTPMLRLPLLVVIAACGAVCPGLRWLDPDIAASRDSVIVQSQASGKPMTPQVIPRNLLDAQDDPKLVESLRSQGFVFVDRVTGESIREMSPCRYEITQKLSSGESRRASVEVGCLIAPTVDVSVVALEDGSFRYSYTLKNGAMAEQSIYGLSIQLPVSDIVTANAEAEGWRFTTVSPPSGPNRAVWWPLWRTPVVAPGQKSGALSIASRYWPGVTDAIFLGSANDRILKLEEEPSQALDTALARIHQKAKVPGTTIGPMFPPPSSGIGLNGIIDHLDADIGSAAARGLVAASAVSALHRALAEARLAVGTPERLKALGNQVRGLGGVNPNYRHALAVALRALANPVVPRERGTGSGASVSLLSAGRVEACRSTRTRCGASAT